jgi:hypothetical protein
MRRNLARFAVAASVVLAVTLPGISAATAGPYINTTTSLSNASPLPGGPDQVTAGGYQPGSTADFIIHSGAPVDLGTAVADANGVVTKIVMIPATFTPGSKHTINIVGVDPSGQQFVASIELTLGGVAAPSSSSSTGTSVGSSGTGTSGTGTSGTGTTVGATNTNSGGKSLPFTGADHVAAIAATAAVLVVLGTFITFAARRRRALKG